MQHATVRWQQQKRTCAVRGIIPTCKTGASIGAEWLARTGTTGSRSTQMHTQLRAVLATDKEGIAAPGKAAAVFETDAGAAASTLIAAEVSFVVSCRPHPSYDNGAEMQQTAAAVLNTAHTAQYMQQLQLQILAAPLLSTRYHAHCHVGAAGQQEHKSDQLQSC
jgi:hypothetical protein